MGEATREIRTLRRKASKRRFYEVSREKGFFVVLNLLTRKKKFYARASDIQALLDGRL